MINKIDSTQNFKGITIIKTKKPVYINFLDDVNTKVWNKQAKPQYSFRTVATSDPKDGYFDGVLLTGKDTFASVKDIQEKGKEKIVNTPKDIFNLPELKKIKKTIKSLFDKFTK